MAGFPYGSARTKPRVRAELQASKEKTSVLARRYGLSRTTVTKWRERASTSDARMGASFLSDAGKDTEDTEGLAKSVVRFESDTGWHPARTEHIAGAFRFTRYDLMKHWALKYIAWKKGEPTDTTTDHDLTDWGTLASFVDTIASIKPAVPAHAGL